MSRVVKEIHLIGGIQVNVYKASNIQPSSVAILFLLHGRKGSAKEIDPIARTILEKNTENDHQQRKLWVVTLVKKSSSLESCHKYIDFVAAFRIIVTMDRDLLTQRPILHGPPIKSATTPMRMSTPQSNHKRKHFSYNI